MNLLDELIAAINPVAGTKRAAARLAMEQIRNYDAAGKNRRTTHWRRSAGDADRDLVPSLQLLRDTSRNMVRNNPYAFQAIEGLVTNIIGTGIRADITTTGDDKKTDKVLNTVKSKWKAWAETTDCDFSGNLNFYGIQELSARSMFESGECLIIRRKLTVKDGGVIPLRVQVLEPDYIDTHRSYIQFPNGNYIQQGIEYNSKGRRVAYWLFKEHPGSITGIHSVSERYPAEDVIHLYRQLRPGQERGVPAGVASFMRLNDFDDYEDAELMRQKIASCFVAFVSGGTDGLPTVDPTDTTGKQPREKMAPGIIEHLDQGKTITFATPPVTTGQEVFARQALRGIAAGYGVTYEVLTGDLSNVNFSSGRMGWIEFSRRIQNIQANVFIPKECDRIFKWFMEGVFLTDSIAANAVSVDWTAPRREMIDILKETKAIGQQILFGLTSWSEAVRELGYNADDLRAQILKDKESFEKLGITVMSDPNNPAVQNAGKNSGAPPVDNGGNNSGNTGDAGA